MVNQEDLSKEIKKNFFLQLPGENAENMYVSRYGQWPNPDLERSQKYVVSGNNSRITKTQINIKPLIKE